MTTPLRRRSAVLALALVVVSAGTLGLTTAVGASPAQGDPSATTVPAATTGAGTDAAPSGTPSTDPPLRPPTTLAEDPFAENCPPGNIVRGPDCGRAPQSKDDPGGWLQVSLFFLVCGVVLGIGAFVWWRARAARAERKAAGLDPVDVARRRGEGLRPSEKVPPSGE